MKGWYPNSQKSESILLTLCFIGLIISLKAFAFGVILISLYTIIEKIKRSSTNYFFKNKISLLVVALYLLYFFGLFYSSDVKSAMFTLEKMLSLLILPISLASLPPLKPKFVYLTLNSFCLLVFFTCLFLWGYSYIEFTIKGSVTFTDFLDYFNSYNRSSLSNHSLINFHYPYLGIIIATALLFIICYFNSHSYKPLFFLMGLFLLLFLIQLKSKMSLIALLCSITIFLAFKISKKNPKLFIAFFLLLIFAGAVSLLVMPEFIRDSLDQLMNADGGSRLRNWEEAIAAFKQAPLFGFGTGDSLEALQQQRSERSWEYEQQYNAHNQYLDITLRFGLIGLTFWLFFLGYMIRKSLKKEQYFFTLFLLLFALCCFTEVLLARFHGVALFALILSIFANISGRKEEDDYSTAIKKDKFK